MTTFRKAHINCPKCGAPITVRDNGGLTPDQADRMWAAFNEAFAKFDKAFRTIFRIHP